MGQVQFSNLSSTGAGNSPFVSAPQPTQAGSPGAAIAKQAFTATPAPSTPQPTFSASGNAYANQVLAPGLNSPHTSAAASAALTSLRAGLASTQFSGGEAPRVNPSVVASRQDNATSAGFAGQVFSGGASTT